MFSETIEKINAIDYRLSKWTYNNGWVRFTLEKIEDNNGKKLLGKRSTIDIPDATRSCKAEYFKETLSKAKRDIACKQGKKPLDFEK